MTELKSPGSRVVLVGTQSCANDVAAPPVPAVESTMDDLAQVLMRRCGVVPEQIIRILDSADPMRMGLAVAEAAEEATDVLLVHYVGHGFVSSDGELYLATKATDPESYRLEHSSVPYASIRRSLLNSRARAVVVVLDCCFSGRAIGTLSAQDPVDLADVHGGYVLTSAARDQVALAPPGARHTAFTGELIRLLDRGDAGGPPLLSMRDVFRSLDRELHRRGLPRPRQRGSERIDDLVLAPNAAHTATAVPPQAAPLPPAPTSGRQQAAPPPPAQGKRGVFSRVATPGKRLLIALVAAGAVLVVAVQLVPSDPGPSTPPPSACASQPALDDCDLPAPSTALDGNGRFVTLHQEAASIVRYQQRPGGALAPPDELGEVVAHGAVILPDSNKKLIAVGVDEFGRLLYNLAIGGDVRAAQGNWRQLADVGDARGRPAAAKDGAGKITVVFRGAGDKLWRISQLEAGADKWGSAVPMGDENSAAIFGDPEVHIDRNGALRVFALDKETRTLRAWAQKPGQSFNENPQNPFRDRRLKEGPTVALQDGRMHLFALDESGALWQTIEGDPNSWPANSNPVPGLEGVHAGSPVAATNADRGVTVFAQLAEKPGRVVYASGGGPGPVSGTLDQPMDVLWSVTPDEFGRLTVHGEKGGAMVTDSL